MKRPISAAKSSQTRGIAYEYNSSQKQYIPTYYFSHHQQPPSTSSSKLYQYKTPRIQSSKNRRHPQTLHPRQFYQAHEIDSNSLPKINNIVQSTNIGPKRPLKILRNGPNEEEFKEDFSLIEAMWDDIGVLPTYRKAFETKARTLPKNQQKELIKYENEELKHIRNNLKEYNKYFTNRNDAINKLKKYNEVFVQSYSNGKEILGDAFVKDIEKAISEIRIYSVNLIMIFEKLRKLTSYGVNHGKYDLTKANKAYKYNSQILFLLDEDLSFLQWSPFWKYFNINEEEYDTFLVNIASNHNSNNNAQQLHKSYQQSSSNGTIINADINEDLMNSIKRCQFIKKQEEIYYETDKLLLEEEQVKDFSCSSVDASEIKLYGNKKMRKTQGTVRKLKLAQEGDRSYLGGNRLKYEGGLNEDGGGIYKVRDEPYKIIRESGMSMSGEEYKKKIKEMEDQIEFDSVNQVNEAESYKAKGKVRKKKEVVYQEKDKESSKVERSYYDEEGKEDSEIEERRRQEEEEEERKRREEEEKKRKKEERRRQKEEYEKRRKREEEEEKRRKQKEEEEKRRKREEEERKRKQQEEQRKKEEERRRKEEEERRRLQEEEERRKQEDE